MSIFKSTHITERLAAQLRFEDFNVFNQPQFGVPNMTWDTPAVGQISSTQAEARRLQMGLRLPF